MKIVKIAIWITVPFFLLILFASFLTTKPYLLISKGLYDSHDSIDFDHDFAIDRIIGYLNYRNDDLNVLYGTDENSDPVTMEQIEIDHMKDVKNLYTYLRIAAVSSLFIAGSLSLLLYKYNKDELYKTFKTIYIGPLFFLIFVGGYIIIDFEVAFTAFHKMFFTNDDWQIPYNVLLPLLPTMFWMVSRFIILILFSGSIGLIYYLNEYIYKKRIS